MRIKIYAKDPTKLIQEQALVGKDSNGGYYLLDVEHIAPFDSESRESLELISWNNVDFKKEAKIRATLDGESRT